MEIDWGKEIKETVLYIIVGLVAAYVLSTGLGFALGTEKPIMAVVSDSMEPTLYKGDLIIVKGVDLALIEEGDIIVFHNRFRGIDVVHRIVEIKESEMGRIFITKGDNNLTNPYPDQVMKIAPPVTEDMVKGRVLKVVPKLGWIRVIFTEIASNI